LIKNCNFLSLGLPKDFQATEEAFSPQKRSSSTSRHENSLLFPIFVGNFALTDPDPATQINANPRGSTTLIMNEDGVGSASYDE
jgi:hypothetical protein